MRPSLFSTLASDPGLGRKLTQQLLELVAQGKTPGFPRFNILPQADGPHARTPHVHGLTALLLVVTCNGVSALLLWSHRCGEAPGTQGQ